MRNINDIFNIITKENIIFEEVKFKNGIEGIYFKIPGLNPTIGIKDAIVNDNSKKYISVLAEELGHHFTTLGDLTAECFVYSDKIYRSKQERKARMWAANYLISDSEFVQALHTCKSTVEDMSEHFNVTEEIIKYKILSISLNELKYMQIRKNFKCMDIQYNSCAI